MRVHFEGVVRGRKEDREVDARLYMSQWYGNLYVVVEGWRDLDLTDPDIDTSASFGLRSAARS